MIYGIVGIIRGRRIWKDLKPIVVQHNGAINHTDQNSMACKSVSSWFITVASPTCFNDLALPDFCLWDYHTENGL